MTPDNYTPEDDAPFETGTAIAAASPMQLAALQDLGVAAAQIQAAHPRGGGEPLLRMMKGDGTWVLGIDAEPIEEGSLWAVNPLQCAHGYIAWSRDPKAATKKVGEIMVPINKPKPDRLNLPEVGATAEWTDQLSLVLRCVSGEDEGTQAQFKSNSLGGVEACVDLIAKIGERARNRSTEVVPVVTLTHTSYQHPSYGLIHKPILKMVRWTDINGETLTSVAPRGTPEPAIAAQASKAGEPVRRRRSI
jgi:hypothetical protein